MQDPDAGTRSTGPSHRSAQAERLVVGGRVQGVGFRPFIYRLAHALGICGSVQNQLGQVEILAQGPAAVIEDFVQRLLGDAPPLAQPMLLARTPTAARAMPGFTILPSSDAGTAAIHVPPDYFTCDDCLDELHDPADRRFHYPFINCTQCGPRYTLITRLPYDRPNTTMAAFPLCEDCRKEYEDPLSRRFHAEPVACPVCGPRLQFYSEDAGLEDDTNEALRLCVKAIGKGYVVAIKGIGGYHLVCDARNDIAVKRLRLLKPRPHKPLAVMFPQRGHDGLDAIRADAQLSAAQAKHLLHPMRPIVLATSRHDNSLSCLIAPQLNEFGVFLPYSPLHHLLLGALGSPVVATSANLSGEPVLTDNLDVEARLSRVADAYLHHDRPIARPADDPVYRVIGGRPRPLRLGRGCAPLELSLPFAIERPTLAVGGHMKNTVAMAWEKRIVISPHIGDLDAPRSLTVFQQVIEDLQTLYGVRAEHILCDTHSGYASHRWARHSGLPVSHVYHHRAHASTVAGEHPQIDRWLVFTWDGVGLGEDGSLWGGEGLLGRPGQWERVTSFRPFRLPGADKAGREPWRSAMALCWETNTRWSDAPVQTELLHAAWIKGLNSPPTSAVGRIFDAAAALCGLTAEASFEGQGPMQLEAIALKSTGTVSMPLTRDAEGIWRSDWSPLLTMLTDAGLSPAERSGQFHNSLAAALVAQARLMRDQHGGFAVGLSGGVFQNRYLAERVLSQLADEGFEAYLPEHVPCNDAGLCYGQVMEAGYQSNR